MGKELCRYRRKKYEIDIIRVGNRVEAIDMIRGFAFLGIFIANMLIFHSPYLYLIHSLGLLTWGRRGNVQMD